MTTPTQINAQLRAGQIVLAKRVTSEVIQTLGALNMSNIDGSAGVVVDNIVHIADRYHAEATQLGSDSYNQFREASGAIGSAKIAHPVLDLYKVRNATVLAAPYAAKKMLARGATEKAVIKSVIGNTAARISRYTLSGSRDTISYTSLADPQCIGYARVPGANCCEFCAMLAGNTYLSLQSGSGSSGSRRRSTNPQPRGAKFHNNCKCTVVPIFNQSSWPTRVETRSREYAELYQNAAAGGGTEKEIEKRFLEAFSSFKAA